MSITLVRKADIVARIPDRWAEQYRHPNDGADKKAITAKLQALKGTEFTAEQCAAIIGNNSWDRNECYECGKDHPVLVRIGDVPDYEARWVDLCPECVTKASDLIRNPVPPADPSRAANRSPAALDAAGNDDFAKIPHEGIVR
jgi:hypothetical protein